MPETTTDKYSAGDQGLGYIYQARLALLHLLQLPEDTAVFLEKDDDLDFVDGRGGKSLASLKHKAVGDRLTDQANSALAKSTSQLIAPIAIAFNELSDLQKQDFLERILILDGSPLSV